jgi:nucleotide-binding universal stress UspA family protein
MIPKDVLAVVTAPEQEAALSAAEALAGRWSAHVAVLHLAQLPEPVGVSPSFGSDLWTQVLADARKTAATDRDALLKRSRDGATPFELRSVEVIGAAAEAIVAHNAMHGDLSILESGATPLQEAAFEAALFKSGRPVLLMPRGWKGGALGKRILVAWNGKREAARALGDAAPFLDEAEAVHVVTVDAQPAYEGAAAPGVEIAAHLARHGLKVELRQVDGLGRSAEAALVDEARAIGADLIVMGGFGHSRLRQFVFGGVTRALSRNTPLPLLMSH